MPAPVRLPPQIAKLPRQWVLTGVAVLIVYLLLKPSLEAWLGVRLPGFAENPPGASTADSRTSPNAATRSTRDAPQSPRDRQAAERTEGAAAGASSTSGRSANNAQDDSTVPLDAESPGGGSASDGARRRSTSEDEAGRPEEGGGRSSTSEKPSQRGAARGAPVAPPASGTPEPENDEPELGVLRETARNVFVSTAGLVYRPGSVDGHRIDHVLQHGRDDPDKPVHGVFDGTREEILAVIDEAYLLSQQRGPPQVVIEDEGDRTVVTVNLGRRIGYMGGQRGQQRRRPALKKLRLVLEDAAVVTAYPTD